MVEKQKFSLAEIERKYPDRWLAVKVEERDNSGQPIKVTLIEKNQDLYDVRRRNTDEDLCIFFTGSIPQSGVVLML